MSFNEQQPPPPPSHLFGSWSDLRQNLPGFPFNHDDHEFLCQYGSVVDHPDMLAHKRARQSEDNLPNFPPRTNPPPPAAGRGGTGHIFYKTRLCVKFSDGNCRNGDSCNFAHGVHDLRQPPSNWQELVGGGGGKELGTGRCDEEHRKNHNNVRVCKRYYNGEECPYGEKCVFLHERPSPTPTFLDDSQFGTAGAGGRESVAISIGVSSNQGRTGGYKSETNNKPHLWKSRNHFDHVLQTGSRSRNEADTTVKSRVIQSKPFVAAASPFVDPVVAVAGDPSIKTRENDDDNAASRWKLNKKINRIYADWLDDLSPLRNVVSEPEA